MPMDRSTQKDRNPAALLVVVLFASLIGAVRVWQSPARSEGADLTARVGVSPERDESRPINLAAFGNALPSSFATNTDPTIHAEPSALGIAMSDHPVLADIEPAPQSPATDVVWPADDRCGGAELVQFQTRLGRVQANSNSPSRP